MGWFIGIGIVIGIEIARIDDEVDSDSDSDSDFDALHEVAVDKMRIADSIVLVLSERSEPCEVNETGMRPVESDG